MSRFCDFHPLLLLSIPGPGLFLSLFVQVQMHKLSADSAVRALFAKPYEPILNRQIVSSRLAILQLDKMIFRIEHVYVSSLLKKPSTGLLSPHLSAIAQLTETDRQSTYSSQ